MMNVVSNKGNKPRILGIVGATASGKTSLSLKVARLLNAEIICMDSMQIYRHMDIGTAKPTAEERALVPHHLIDIVDPSESFSVAEYVPLAHACIADVLSRGHVPLLVGGTGLYLQGISMPLDYGGLPSDPEIRSELQKEYERYGADALHNLLRSIDPDTAARLHPHDIRRVIRAIEIYRLTGIPMSEHRLLQSEQSPYDMRLFAISWPRDELHRRIGYRVDEMMEQGLFEEVKNLLSQGISPQAQSMQGLGYKELIPVINGTESILSATEHIKTGTRNYARRQLIWYRRDQRIHWLDSEHLDEAAEEVIRIWSE